MKTRLRVALATVTIVAMGLPYATGAAVPEEAPLPPDLERQQLDRKKLDLAAFTDSGSSAFAADIDWLADSGITRGCDPPQNTRYCPDQAVTRGQMAAFLHRALPGLTASGSPGFTDTVSSAFEPDISWLAAAGITRGCNPPQNTRFCPDQTVTRGQMAAFLTRALDLPAASAPFDDTAGHTFEGDISALAAAGITKGCNPPHNTRFCPDQTVTRGQMAAFLHRALRPASGGPDSSGGGSGGGAIETPEEKEAAIGVGTSAQSSGLAGSSEGVAGDLVGEGPPIEITPAELTTGPASESTIEELEAVTPEEAWAIEIPQMPFSSASGNLHPQVGDGLGGLSSNSYYLSTSGQNQAVGLLLSYRNGQFTGQCTGTLVSRNLVLTAAHCMVSSTGLDYTDYLFYPAYHPQKTNNTAWRSVQGWRWPIFNQLRAQKSTSAFAVDYGLVQLAPNVNAVHAGDIYGAWSIYLSPALNDSFERWVPKRWDQYRVASGYPTEGWFGIRSGAWPRACESNLGGYWYWGDGYWSMGMGCTTAGGNSGGPIWAQRDGQWYIVSVVSTVSNQVQCGPANAPYTYPCYASGTSRMSYAYNAWGPALLGTSTGYSMRRLWDFANG